MLPPGPFSLFQTNPASVPANEIPPFLADIAVPPKLRVILLSLTSNTSVLIITLEPSTTNFPFT